VEVGIELVESRWVVEVRHQGGRSEGKDVGRKLAGLGPGPGPGPGRSNYNNRERREESSSHVGMSYIKYIIC
jgi:hypothetical protein